jgi:glutathione S-transferase
MKLYYVPRTRATRPRWLLEELGVPYQLERLDVAAGENRRPEYLRLNPYGHVPTLVDGEVVVYESAAICLYLADKFIDHGLAPRFGSPLRGLYYQWMVFSMATLEPLIVTAYDHESRLPEAERVPAIAQGARKHFREVAGGLDQALGDREVLVGDTFTAADVMIASILAWSRLLGLLSDHPRLSDYAKRLMSRPAARRARED